MVSVSLIDWSDDEVEKLKEQGNMKFKEGEYRPAIEVCSPT